MIDDNIKKSIILYNTARGELKKGNFDLVINDLKKSLSYNKGFTEAIKLMGLCYVKMKEYKKAEKTLKKLDKYGMDNELANEYMESLSINKSMAEGIMLTEAAQNMSNDKKKSYSLVKNSKRSLLIILLIVIIVLAGVSITKFYPETIQGVLTKFKTSISNNPKKNNLNNEISNSNEETDSKLDKNEVLLEKNTIVNGEHEDTQKNLVDSKSESDNYKNNTLSMLKNF